MFLKATLCPAAILLAILASCSTEKNTGDSALEINITPEYNVTSPVLVNAIQNEEFNGATIEQNGYIKITVKESAVRDKLSGQHYRPSYAVIFSSDESLHNIRDAKSNGDFSMLTVCGQPDAVEYAKLLNADKAPENQAKVIAAGGDVCDIDLSNSGGGTISAHYKFPFEEIATSDRNYFSAPRMTIMAVYQATDGSYAVNFSELVSLHSKVVVDSAARHISINAKYVHSIDETAQHKLIASTTDINTELEFIGMYGEYFSSFSKWVFLAPTNLGNTYTLQSCKTIDEEQYCIKYDDVTISDTTMFYPHAVSDDGQWFATSNTATKEITLYKFHETFDKWEQQNLTFGDFQLNDIPDYAGFGHSLAISNNQLFISAPFLDSGKVYVFELELVQSETSSKIIEVSAKYKQTLPVDNPTQSADNGIFGFSLAAYDNLLAITDPHATNTAQGKKNGVAYIYQLKNEVDADGNAKRDADGTVQQTWQLSTNAKIKLNYLDFNIHEDPNTGFGLAVDLYDGRLAVSEPLVSFGNDNEVGRIHLFNIITNDSDRIEAQYINNSLQNTTDNSNYYLYGYDIGIYSKDEIYIASPSSSFSGYSVDGYAVHTTSVAKLDRWTYGNDGWSINEQINNSAVDRVNNPRQFSKLEACTPSSNTCTKQSIAAKQTNSDLSIGSSIKIGRYNNQDAIFAIANNDEIFIAKDLTAGTRVVINQKIHEIDEDGMPEPVVTACVEYANVIAGQAEEDSNCYYMSTNIVGVTYQEQNEEWIDSNHRRELFYGDQLAAGEDIMHEHPIKVEFTQESNRGSERKFILYKGKDIAASRDTYVHDNKLYMAAKWCNGTLWHNLEEYEKIACDAYKHAYPDMVTVLNYSVASYYESDNSLMHTDGDYKGVTLCIASDSSDGSFDNKNNNMQDLVPVTCDRSLNTPNSALFYHGILAVNGEHFEDVSEEDYDKYGTVAVCTNGSVGSPEDCIIHTKGSRDDSGGLKLLNYILGDTIYKTPLLFDGHAVNTKYVLYTAEDAKEYLYKGGFPNPDNEYYLYSEPSEIEEPNDIHGKEGNILYKGSKPNPPDEYHLYTDSTNTKYLYKGESYNVGNIEITATQYYNSTKSDSYCGTEMHNGNSITVTPQLLYFGKDLETNSRKYFGSTDTLRAYEYGQLKGRCSGNKFEGAMFWHRNGSVFSEIYYSQIVYINPPTTMPYSNGYLTCYIQDPTPNCSTDSAFEYLYKKFNKYTAVMDREDTCFAKEEYHGGIKDQVGINNCRNKINGYLF